jgi:hypothetical protein
MPFIAENTDLMHRDENGVFHCLLVLGEGSSDGVLIEAEGYNYARYSSFMPGAREFVTERLNQLADQIIHKSTQSTSNGTWSIYFNEIQERTCPVSPDNHRLHASKNLETRQEMAEIGLWRTLRYGVKPRLLPNLDESQIPEQKSEQEPTAMQMNLIKDKTTMSTTELKSLSPRSAGCPPFFQTESSNRRKGMRIPRQGL